MGSLNMFPPAENWKNWQDLHKADPSPPPNMGKFPNHSLVTLPLDF